MDDSKLINEIRRLKKEKNALVLAHFYQPGEIQVCADFVGDSLDLSRRAASADAGMIVFCGVYFMAESAKILSPHKKVLIPRADAGCPMADMIKPEDIMALRERHPSAAVVIYVNSSAACKAVSDICCTSSNARDVIASLDAGQVIFVPDRNLGRFIAKGFPEKEFFYFDGCCPIHDALREDDVLAAKAAHPGVRVAAHPECPPEVLALADFCGSTSQIIDFTTKEADRAFIIATEEGIIYKLQKNSPGKQFFSAKEQFICPDMKKISLSDLYECLSGEEHEVLIDDETARRASGCLERMLAI